MAGGRPGLRKRIGLGLFADLYADKVRQHRLRTLFWECTLRCNLACRHCGSDCRVDPGVKDMPLEDFLRVLDEQVTPHVNPRSVLLIFSGGEVLVRPDLEVAGAIGLSQMTALNIALILTAVWWLVTTLPLLKSYRQLHYVEVEEHAVRQSFVRIGQTLRHLPEDKQVFWFLLAFFCYIDGVYTIIDMATAYGTALGLDTTGLLLALLVTQIVAFPSALIFGRLSNEYPSSKLIPVCIAAYAGIAVFAFFLTRQWQFWVLAVIVGMFQGGVQALSRSHFAKIIPPEKSGEYFGLFDICGKGASFLGTMIVSVGSQLTGSANVGVGSLIVLFVVGFVLFRVSCRQGETA